MLKRLAVSLARRFTLPFESGSPQLRSFKMTDAFLATSFDSPSDPPVPPWHRPENAFVPPPSLGHIASLAHVVEEAHAAWQTPPPSLGHVANIAPVVYEAEAAWQPPPPSLGHVANIAQAVDDAEEAWTAQASSSSTSQDQGGVGSDWRTDWHSMTGYWHGNGRPLEPTRSGANGGDLRNGISGGSHRDYFRQLYAAKARGKGHMKRFIEKHGPPPSKGGKSHHPKKVRRFDV